MHLFSNLVAIKVCILPVFTKVGHKLQKGQVKQVKEAWGTTA